VTLLLKEAPTYSVEVEEAASHAGRRRDVRPAFHRTGPRLLVWAADPQRSPVTGGLGGIDSTR